MPMNRKTPITSFEEALFLIPHKRRVAPGFRSEPATLSLM
jgi:hypothetical protein